MSDSDDPIRRSSDLGPPDRAEIISLHILTAWVMEKPKLSAERLASILAIARDGAMETNVLQLHARADDPEWRESFRGAAIRIEGAAAMLFANLPPAPKLKRRGKKR